MFRMRRKDLALVAFAVGLLGFELVGLHAAAPAALRTLAGIAGMRGVQEASRGARAATHTMVDGLGVAAAQAAALAMDGTVEGAAHRVGAATPVTVRWAAASTQACPTLGYVMVVRSGRAEAKQAHMRLVAWRSECRATVRAIRAQRQAEAARRAMEVTSEASAL